VPQVCLCCVHITGTYPTPQHQLRHKHSHLAELDGVAQPWPQLLQPPADAVRHRLFLRLILRRRQALHNNRPACVCACDVRARVCCTRAGHQQQHSRAATSDMRHTVTHLPCVNPVGSEGVHNVTVGGSEGGIQPARNRARDGGGPWHQQHATGTLRPERMWASGNCDRCTPTPPLTELGWTQRACRAASPYPPTPPAGCGERQCLRACGGRACVRACVHACTDARWHVCLAVCERARVGRRMQHSCLSHTWRQHVRLHAHVYA
jgi:hypothetical protein